MTIFHTRQFFELHGGSHYFQAGEVSMPVWATGGTVHSPLRGTFAGPSKGDVADVEKVLCAAESIGSIQHIALAPQGHDGSHFANCVKVMRARRYKISELHLNFERKINGAFEDSISDGQRKRISKCEREGMYAGVCPSKLDTCYAIIVDNRLRKGREYSMSLDAWKKMQSLFPESVVSFVVGLKDVPVAAAICLRLSPEILYVQAWGEIAGQEEYSPVALLCKTIYRWCGEHGVKLLDVGTAEDPGLIAFKERLGFKPSLKLTMSRYGVK